jgi:hypothetical protein
MLTSLLGSFAIYFYVKIFHLNEYCLTKFSV